MQSQLLLRVGGAFGVKHEKIPPPFVGGAGPAGRPYPRKNAGIRHHSV